MVLGIMAGNLYSQVSSLEGSGTELDPYLVQDLQDLITISENSSIWDKHFIQTADIDASSTSSLNDGAGFSPIGTSSNRFTGSYNGQGHTISNLYINRPSTNYIGLFGYTQSAEISNLSIINAEIVGNYNVGGLVGLSEYSTINNSYASGAVSGVSYVGGLLGRVPSDSSFRTYIINSYATADVSGSSNYIGGLVGYYYPGSYIRNSYSTGSVSGSSYVGGLVGSFSYSSSSYISNSFWDTETSGQSSSAGGTGKTTAEMQEINTYLNAGWDFEEMWLINPGINDGYPTFFNKYIRNIALSNYMTNISLNPTISCDILSDFVYYEIKFGTEENPQEQLVEFSLINETISYTFAEPLEYYTDYYWTLVLATANFDLTTIEFNFRTRPQFEGLGTEDNPYEIANFDHLQTISEYETLLDKYFIQVGNIDASATLELNDGEGFSPIGTNRNRFMGSYNGQDYTISNIYINRPSTDYVGLFGYTQSASISNLGIADAEITGDQRVGGLVGFAYSSSTISNSYVTGVVSGNYYVGGLVGFAFGTISNSYAKVAVSGTGHYVGGLVGYIFSPNNTSSSIILNCYTYGSVSGSSYVGGLIGGHSSYESIVLNSFWDIETSGQTTSDGGTGLTSQELQNIYTYIDAGWDFLPEEANGEENIWYIHPNHNSGYPFFANAHLDIPLHAISFYPYNEMTNLPTTDNLHWEDDYLENTDGYNVSLGTDNPPSNVIDSEDLSLVTSYDFSNLQAHTTYYWQVIPYNANGDAEDCPIWSFTTGSQDLISVGRGPNTHEQLPINYQYKKSYSQSIYLQSDLAMNRDIEKLSFYVSEQSYFSGANQWKIYLGHTDKSEFTANNDWLLGSQGLLEVANITLNDTIQTGWIDVDLTNPFVYNNNDNLIVGVIEFNAESSETLSNNFYTTDTESNRTISFSHDTISPNINIPFNGELNTSIPKICFTFSEAITTFTGLVKNSSGTPIANSTIQIENLATIQSDENGSFDVADVLPGTYQLTVSAPWYETQIIEYEVIEGQDNYLEITLLEDLLPASSLTATLAEDLTNVELTWTQPTLARVSNSSKQARRSLTKEKLSIVEKQGLEQRTGQPELVYNLYRYLAGDEASPDNWLEVATDLDALTYSDTSFLSLDLGSYYWAVQAVYPNDRLAQATISNQIDKQATIETNIDEEINFGTIYLTNASEYEEIIITNSGSGTLTISEITCEESAFNLLYDSADFIVEPNSSLTLQVNFAPDNPGSYVSDLVIANNSNNEPNYTLSLRGFCQYIPPADPEGVQVTMANNTAQISWDPVTEDIYENPITPDLYIVYFNGLNTQDDNHFYYLGTTNQLSYDHINVGAFSEFMFYRVKAYVDVDNAVLSHINDLVSQKRKVSLKEVESLISNRKGKAILKD